ncbi:LAGLIDADG family homing endonuclease [Candidatus Peregrinibacteria bacterium]|nr:LAGLIDADG family homing endonuclease [Candidatus Peregrinibacteria bacterium]
MRYYIYFAQKNKRDLEEVKKYLEELGISSGITHNPSKIRDSHYWRFFIRAKSYRKFASIIGSWHPVKSKFVRVKI